MKEQTYIEQISKMKEAGLCRTSPASAKIYASQLKAGTPLSMLANQDGILEADQGILDLEGQEELQRLNQWQAERKLSDKERAALKLFLRIHEMKPLTKREAQAAQAAQDRRAAQFAQASQAAQAAQETQREKIQSATTLKMLRLREYEEREEQNELPVSLYTILSALRQTTKNRREVVSEPAYTLLMRALLLNDGFYWTSDMTEQELRPGGSHYEENIQIIAINLQDDVRRKEVQKRLQEALWELEGQWDSPQLRMDVGRACAYLEREVLRRNDENARMYEGSAIGRLLHRMTFMEKGISGLIYQNLSMEDLTEDLMQLILLAIETGRGIWQSATSFAERKAKLSKRECMALAVIGSGLPVRTGTWKRQELQTDLLGLLRCDMLQPVQGGAGLTTMPDVELDMAGGLTALWEGVIDGEDGSAMLWDVFTELLDAKSAFIEERISSSSSQADLQLHDGLRELLTQIREDDVRRLPVLRYLICVAWSRIKAADMEEVDRDIQKKAIDGTEWLLLRIKREPEAVAEILTKALNLSRREQEGRLVQRNGVSLFEGELACQCAGRYLQLAMDDRERQEYWASCAVAKARSASRMLSLLGAEQLELEARLTLALASLVEGNGAAGAGKAMNGEMALSDYLIPAAQELKRAEEIVRSLSDGEKEDGKALLAHVREGCRMELFGDGQGRSHLADHLAAKGLWEQVRPYGSFTYEDCLRICEFRENDGDCDWLEWQKTTELLLRRDQRAELFLPWYCNTFDSTLASGPICTQERTEAAMLQILLSGQRITLSLNQMVDNEKIRNLAEVPAFLWMLRRGLVTVSFFGGLRSLKEYAVTRMRNPGFVWSSLPKEFVAPELREHAARWLEGSGSLASLPAEQRMNMVKMREAIERMDENLGIFWKHWYDQNDSQALKLRSLHGFGGSGNSAGLTERLTAYYSQKRQEAGFNMMKQLNQLLLDGGMISNRSDYRKGIWAIEQQDSDGMKAMGVSLKELERLHLTPEELVDCHEDITGNMIRIVDECHNRMLGERISPHQCYIYDRKTALLLPEWQGAGMDRIHRAAIDELKAQGAINEAGCLLYRQMEAKPGREESAHLLSWELAAERIRDLRKLADKMPWASAEQLCNRLVNQGLDEYSVFGSESSLRLRKLAFRASTGSAVKREMQKEGDLYQEERHL